MALIQYLTQIQFEFGAIKLAARRVRTHRHPTALIVTDAGVRAAGVLQKALDALGDLDVAVFDQTPSNPTEASVRAAVEVYRANRCDGLIAVGGGSAIDCAKGVAIAATHDGPLKTYATIEGRLAEDHRCGRSAHRGAHHQRHGQRGGARRDRHRRRPPQARLPQLVPDAQGCHLRPRAHLRPAAETDGRDRHGCDCALHGNLHVGRLQSPADGIALDGLERAWLHIERATKDGQDREARLNLMSASMQGAMAFQKGLGCVHSLSHSLGGVDPRLHHGTLNALFLPAVIRFNAGAESVQKDRRLQRMAQAMHLDSAGDLGDAIRDMSARLGLPKGLAEVGVTRDLFEKVIDGAMADHCHKTNPRLATRDDYREMLESAM